MRLVLLLLIVAAVGISVVIAVLAQADQPDYPTIPTWPALTMLYETDGVTYSLGSSPAVTTREVHRLGLRVRDRVD